MLTDFAQRFDAYYDLRLYHQCSGYRYEGDYRVWEPQDWTELEPDTTYTAPGAMAVGELDDYDCSDCDEF